MDCIFCKIINNEIPTEIIYEDDKLIAFDDIHPKSPTHILIIPKKHMATLNDASDTDTLLLGEILQTAKKLATQLGVAKNGYRTVLNCNPSGGQEVYHLHLHLLAGRQMSPALG